MATKSDLSSVFSVVRVHVTPSSVQQDSGFDSNRKNEERENFKNNELKLRNSLPEVVGRVNFDPCPKFYALDDELVVNFTVEPKMESASQDWIGLFRSDWSSLDQYIAFQWVPFNEGKLPANLSVTFDTSKLPLHVKFGPVHLYQFAYVSNKSCIVSRSSPFWFQSAVKDSEVEIHPNISKDGITVEDLESSGNDKPVAISLTSTVMGLSRNSSMTEDPKPFSNVAGCSLPSSVNATGASILFADEDNLYGSPPKISSEDTSQSLRSSSTVVYKTISESSILQTSGSNPCSNVAGLSVHSSSNSAGASVLLAEESNLYGPPLNLSSKDVDNENLDRIVNTTTSAHERLKAGSANLPLQSSLSELFFVPENEVEENDLITQLSRLKQRIEKLEMDASERLHDGNIKVAFKTNLNFGSVECDSKESSQSSDDSGVSISNLVAFGNRNRDDLPLNTNDSSVTQQWTKVDKSNQLQSFITSQLQMIDTMLTDDTPVKLEANVPRTSVVQILPGNRDCGEANVEIASTIRGMLNHLLRAINEHCSNKQIASVGVQWKENAAKVPSSLTGSRSETKVRPQPMTHQFSTDASSGNELANRKSSDSSLCMIVIPLESIKKETA